MTQQASTAPQVAALPPTAASAAPLDLAAGYVRHTGIAGMPTIHRWRGEWWGWEGAAYAARSDEEVRADMYDYLAGVRVGDGGSVQPRQRTVSETLDALSAVVQLPAGTEPPCWLRASEYAPRDIVPVSNGLIHLPTGRLLPPSPTYWCHAASDVAYSADAPDPVRWHKFVYDDTWTDDRESADTLQEVMGYLLSGSTAFQKIPLLVGPRRAGKGTILHVIRRLVGSGNVSAPALSGLGLPFGLAPLIGKSVALISDARISGRADLAAVVETLLRVSGEDVVTVPRKFKADWTGPLRVRFVIASNELPRLDDASGALASRLVPLLLTRSHYGAEDHGLLGALEEELPGIMLWALEGLHRLRARGRFQVPATAQEVWRDMRALASPVSVFLDEVCRLDSTASTPCADVYTGYRQWAETQGIRPASAQMFGRDLRAAAPGVRVSMPRDGAQRTRVYSGLALDSAALPHTPTQVCQRCDGAGCEWCDE